MEEAGVNLSQRYTATGRAIDGQNHSIPSCRWRTASAIGRGDKAVGSAHICRTESIANSVRWTTGEHAGPIERIGAHTVKGGVVGKQVHRQEIGVLSRASARVP